MNFCYPSVAVKTGVGYLMAVVFGSNKHIMPEFNHTMIATGDETAKEIMRKLKTCITDEEANIVAFYNGCIMADKKKRDAEIAELKAEKAKAARQKQMLDEVNDSE